MQPAEAAARRPAPRHAVVRHHFLSLFIISIILLAAILPPATASALLSRRQSDHGHGKGHVRRQIPVIIPPPPTTSRAVTSARPSTISTGSSRLPTSTTTNTATTRPTTSTGTGTDSRGVGTSSTASRSSSAPGSGSSSSNSISGSSTQRGIFRTLTVISETSTPAMPTSQITRTSAGAPLSSGTPTRERENGGTGSQDQLPLTPRLTPGLGVAGVVLLVTGLPYAFVGIKVSLLQIYLSTAYLGALGVTVLVLYLASMPISEVAQGGYVAVAILGGALLGVPACIFRDVTEGVASVLGGFCAAMWLLTLVNNGLVQFVAARIVLISGMCLLAFALYFARWTRPYVLIGSIAFAGATATILGIDCFTRAGLKEFWAFVWDLNPSLFPADTTMYSVTRAMRAESIMIAIITLLGVISQQQLGKVMKARRAQGAVEAKTQKQDMERQDEEIGREVEARTVPERQQWKAVYGSGQSSSPSVMTNDSSFLGKLGSAEKGTTGALRTRVTEMDSVSERSVNQDTGSRSQSEPKAGAQKMASRSSQNPALSANDTRLLQQRTKLAPIPTLRVPNNVEVAAAAAIAEAESDEDQSMADRSSLATFNDLDGDNAAEEPQKQTATEETTGEIKRPGSALSSKAATMDGASTVINKSGAREQENEAEDNISNHKSESKITIKSLRTQQSSLTEERLPKRVSKVATSYRTNEWAKHLSHAEAPELGPGALSPDLELPVRVDIFDLQPSTIVPPPPAQPVTDALAAATAAAKRSFLTSSQSASLRSLPPSSQTPQVPAPPTMTTTASSSSPSSQPSQRSLGASVRLSSRVSTNVTIPTITEDNGEHTEATDMPIPSTATKAMAEPGAGRLFASPPGARNLSSGNGVLYTSLHTLPGRRELQVRNNRASLLPPPSRSASGGSAPSLAAAGNGYISPAAREAQLAPFRHAAAHDLLASAPTIRAPSAARSQDSLDPGIGPALGLNSAAATMKRETAVQQSIDAQRRAIRSEKQAAAVRREAEKMQRDAVDRAFTQRMQNDELVDAHREVLRRMQRMSRTE